MMQAMSDAVERGRRRFARNVLRGAGLAWGRVAAATTAVAGLDAGLGVFFLAANPATRPAPPPL
jgi:hypothetical protein